MVEKVFYTEQEHCDHSLDEVESTAYHPCSGGMAGIACHNSPVEYKRPCSCYFPPELGRLRMIQCYTNEGRNWYKLFAEREWSS